MSNDAPRTIEALKLIVEELEEHSLRLKNVENNQNDSQKVANQQAHEILALQTKVRNLEIKTKAKDGTPKKELAKLYNLTPGRISQITNEQ